jgi:para-nitrobenzyl esterase
MRSLSFNFFALLAGLLLSACAASAQSITDSLPAQDSFVVQTSAGFVRGIARPGGGAEFLGIPYAQPPVGDLRWRVPEPAKPWPGVRDAAKFGGACPQPLLDGAWNRYDVSISTEDCLFLNVITPAWHAAKPLPVMFWIHGGANLGGSASSDLYRSGTLPEHGVVVVTVNYRLGILGYLSHHALTLESPHHTPGNYGASGNYGLLDQILALRWVKDNIAAFGGDPENVTIFGQSDGAKNVGLLMTSPRARGLFQKAICESGSPLYPALPDLAYAQRVGREFAESLVSAASPNPMVALRAMPAQKLIDKAAKFKWGDAPVTPIVDGWVIPRAPAEVFKSGQEAPVPLLVGTTSREFGNSAGDLRATIGQTDGKFADQALAAYGLADGGQGTDDPVYGPPGVQWTADNQFHCPITTVALWHAAAHHATYDYEFDRAIPGQESKGALHSAELPYVFGFFPTSGNIGGNFTDVDTHLADQVETYWTNFARTGNPNGAGLPVWLALDSSHQGFLRFTVDGIAEANTAALRGAQCDVYRKVMAKEW